MVPTEGLRPRSRIRARRTSASTALRSCRQHRLSGDSRFSGAPGYQPILAAALKTLENTDALIIDVRRNGGGSSEMSHMLFSHFLPAQPQNTIRVYSRSSNNTTMRQSIAEVVGPRRTDVPLYVLTSQGTASAAEGIHVRAEEREARNHRW